MTKKCVYCDNFYYDNIRDIWEHLQKLHPERASSLLKTLEDFAKSNGSIICQDGKEFDGTLDQLEEVCKGVKVKTH